MKRLTQLAASLPHWPYALALLALLAVRDSQNLLRPEFYAEDGAAWYADAYTDGLASLAIPRGGYLNSVQRLVAIAAQPLPLSWAPLAFNLFAYAAYAALVLFLISSRMDAAWPQRGARRLFALLLALMPATHEIFGILTNVQWVIAPLAFLVLASRAPVNWRERIFDGVVLLLCGVSGPFGLFLLPFAAWRWWRAGAPAWRLGLLLLGAVLQAGYLSIALGDRPDAQALGASPALFLRIVALVALMAEFGQHLVGIIAYTTLWRWEQAPGIALGIGVLLAYAVGWRLAPPLLRWFMLYSGLVFLAALYKPVIDPHPGLLQWPLMVERPPAGGRYYLYPMIAWWGVLFACAAQQGELIPRTARVLLACTCLIAIPSDWPRWAPDRYDDFQTQARAFEQATPGTRMVFAIKPRWIAPMVLVKKP